MSKTRQHRPNNDNAPLPMRYVECKCCGLKVGLKGDSPALKIHATDGPAYGHTDCWDKYRYIYRGPALMAAR